METNRGKQLQCSDSSSNKPPINSRHGHEGKAENKKSYSDPKTSSDHRYRSKPKEVKEYLQKDGKVIVPSVRRGDHSRHKTHPVTRPRLTRHLSLNLPLFVTNADFASVPRAGRLSMYATSNKSVPDLHPIQGVGLLEDHSSRTGLKRSEQNAKRHNSLTPLEKVPQDIPKGSLPATLKMFTRSQRQTQLTSRLMKCSSDQQDCEHFVQLRSYNVSHAHAPPLARFRSRSTCSENDAAVILPSNIQPSGGFHTENLGNRGAIAKGKSSSKYKADLPSSCKSSTKIRPVKRSTNITVPYAKGELDSYDQDSSGFKAPVSTPQTAGLEKLDLACSYCQSSDGGKSSASARSSVKRQDTRESEDWSEIGVTLSQIRLNHSQSQPFIKDFATRMTAENNSEDILSDTMHEAAIPVLKISSLSEVENKVELESTVTINAPFIMFRPATPRMPEREEKTHDHEIGKVLVKAASQAEVRRKEMRRLLEDIQEFNAANKSLYRKVKID